MADSASGNLNRFLNPWVLHFQKLGLELKCPLCLDLLNKPILLPCQHIFCSSCISNSSQFRQDCFVCQSPYVDLDLRSAAHIENIVSIYKNMDAAFSASRSQPCSQSHTSDGKDPMTQSLDSANTVAKLQKAVKEIFPNKQVQNPLSQTENVKPLVSGSKRKSGVTVGQNTLPGSPPSFGETKDSDDDSSGHGGQNGAERFHTMDKTVAELENQANCDTETKRQKLSATVMNPKPGYSGSDGGCKSGALFGAHQASTSVCLDGNSAFICAFCQTFKISEGSGSMLHIASGLEVEGDEALRPNVVHVHQRCIEWAPQVYYAGETVMNLELELARGSKLKCSCCGLKGAALGCFVRSCKNTYHVPCASGTSGCRWDDEGHQMLCPSHSHVKFPHEKTKKGKKPVKDNTSRSSTIQRENGQTKGWAALAGATSKLTLCGSSLSDEEKHLLANFARISGVTISKNWKPNVTHVIASTDERGACSRTLKFLMAILDGKWVLKIDWIKACIQAMDLVNEEPYEVRLDIHGCLDGPRNGRLRVSEGAAKLFSGLHFYFSGDFVPSYKESLEELVLAAGAIVLTKNSLASSISDEGESSSKTLIVYSLDLPPSLESEEEASHLVIEERLREAQALAEQTGSLVIEHTWILESIAASKHKLEAIVA
ncbi:hypothetical protein MKW94_019786 [Papaver nudicaule]|uniref:Uncharacterized protein n=1 Tax=Papaver nudicaule TaxID=74823 RepID=A0AA41S937_PAPNU|nr:hypothetical protein [Papaver nudicaule]